MNIIVGIVALALLLAVPASAADFYAHGMRVLISPPLAITAPGAVTWTVRLPEFGLVGLPYAKSCAGQPGWDGSVPPEDESLTLYSVRTNYQTGTWRLVFGDRAVGRGYQVCIRLPYYPVREGE